MTTAVSAARGARPMTTNKRRAVAIPDWDWLGDVAVERGLDCARTIMLDIGDGKLTDLGPCPWPGSILDSREAPVRRESLDLAREIQMTLGET